MAELSPALRALKDELIQIVRNPGIVATEWGEEYDPERTTPENYDHYFTLHSGIIHIAKELAHVAATLGKDEKAKPVVGGDAAVIHQQIRDARDSKTKCQKFIDKHQIDNPRMIAVNEAFDKAIALLEQRLQEAGGPELHMVLKFALADALEQSENVVHDALVNLPDGTDGESNKRRSAISSAIISTGAQFGRIPWRAGQQISAGDLMSEITLLKAKLKKCGEDNDFTQQESDSVAPIYEMMDQAVAVCENHRQNYGEQNKGEERGIK